MLVGVLLLALEMVCSLRTELLCCIPDLPFVRVKSDPMEWMPPHVDTSVCFSEKCFEWTSDRLTQLKIKLGANKFDTCGHFGH